VERAVLLDTGLPHRRRALTPPALISPSYLSPNRSLHFPRLGAGAALVWQASSDPEDGADTEQDSVLVPCGGELRQSRPAAPRAHP
jgi:hypothetical protein